MKIEGNNLRALSDVCPRLSPLLSLNPITWSPRGWGTLKPTQLLTTFNGGYIYDS